jgi:carbonic anhydrase
VRFVLSLSVEPQSIRIPWRLFWWQFVVSIVGEGHLAVVAVLLKNGASNALLASIWKNLPAEKEKSIENASVSVNAADLLPSDYRYYTYLGSLTTPPCSEGVTWYVLKTPVQLSSEQVEAFAKVYPMNARPTQPLHGRELLASK